MKKNLKYYKQLSYRTVLEYHIDSDGTKYWTAEYPDLSGCKTDGHTRAEAIKNVQELFDEYIVDRLSVEKDIPVPPPILYVNTGERIYFNPFDRVSFKSNEKNCSAGTNFKSPQIPIISNKKVYSGNILKRP